MPTHAALPQSSTGMFLRDDGTWGVAGGGSVAWGQVTGTLAAQTDLQTAINSKAASAHTHPQSEVTNLVSDLAGKAAASHSHTKADVGLGNVDNTSDVNKPVSTAQQTALNGKLATPVYTVLANDTLAQNFAVNTTTKLTVTANRTLTTTVPAAGSVRRIIILTSGTSSFTITFGSGFKPVGTLATGTTTNRVFVVTFISDGTNLYESSRTAAMVA